MTLDYDAARLSRVDDALRAFEEVTQILVQHLSGCSSGGTRAQINVVPPPTIASVIGGLLPSIYNPNLVSEESSRQVAVAEVEVFVDDRRTGWLRSTVVSGLVHLGGTATILYRVKLGLESLRGADGGVRESGQ